MASIPQRLSELKACPHCGNDGYFTRDWVEGSAITKYKFDGSLSENNENMYQNLVHTSGSRAYCSACKIFLGDVQSDKLSAATEKHIQRITADGTDFRYPRR